MTEALAFEEQESAESASRAPWRRRLAIVLTAIVVLAIALIGLCEFLARMLVPSVAETAIRDQMELPEATEVTVDFSGLVLWQLARGSFSDVSVHVEDVELFEGLTSAVDARIGEVALDPMSAPVDGTQVDVRLAPDQFERFVSSVSEGRIESATVAAGTVTVGTSVDVFGSSVPLSADVDVVPDGPNLTLVPVKFTAAGIETTPEQVATALGGVLGPAAEELNRPQSICIADQLPAGLTVSKLTTSARGALVITVDVDPRITVDPALREPGRCSDGGAS